MCVCGGDIRGECSLAILPWWVYRLLRKVMHTFGKGGALEKYPILFKKITSYNFLPISEILQSVSQRPVWFHLREVLCLGRL